MTYKSQAVIYDAFYSRIVDQRAGSVDHLVAIYENWLNVWSLLIQTPASDPSFEKINDDEIKFRTLGLKAEELILDVDTLVYRVRPHSGSHEAIENAKTIIDLFSTWGLSYLFFDKNIGRPEIWVKVPDESIGCFIKKLKEIHCSFGQTGLLVSPFNKAFPKELVDEFKS